MKKNSLIVAILAIITGLAACSKKEEKEEAQKWEYKVLEVFGLGSSDYFCRGYYQAPTDKFDELGQEGWEMVDAYSKIETVHPNFGNKEYVTGLQPNTRTQSIVYIFKRPCIKGVENDTPYESISNGGADIPTEDIEVEQSPVGEE